MIKTVRRLNGVRTLKPNGSLTFCDSCEKIVGSINEKGYSYINIGLICTCGRHGNIEIIKNKKTIDLSEKIDKMPQVIGGASYCKTCRIPIFSIAEERVKSYSFYAECICGERYDRKGTFDKRLGETLTLLTMKDK